jgi:hypothetical protein
MSLLDLFYVGLVVIVILINYNLLLLSCCLPFLFRQFRTLEKRRITCILPIS